jgi:DNA (cytosine-5)-methyltransferase 1
MNELALFAGAGGGILGGTLLGWRCVCAVEIDDFARRVLMARQDDGSLPAFPIWDDVRTFDGRPWHGLVDVVTGGFPCQDISLAGRGGGLEGERSGLWREMRRIVGEVGPRFVLVENSPALTCRGLEQVLGDLAEMGYDARWGVLGAYHAGAPHRRERIWIVADATTLGGAPGDAGATAGQKGNTGELDHGGQDVGDADGAGCGEQRCGGATEAEQEAAQCAGWWGAEPDVGRVAHGVAARVDRLRCLGNGQVPAVVRLAWETLT